MRSQLDAKKAIEVIENLRDYAFRNWDDSEYGDELDEIGEAVELIKMRLSEGNRVVGMAEIDGKKYLISEWKVKS